ncbi:uncharacterized protein BP5553_10550 [Venustampulla echinocandica]|uniref:Uncharacterized protein n=1 Tax=Venustampulla echinocandica TaxID=2656787 RepID=A0A370T8V2_9HELO|nr:uncharacterized protein BP5553_10550 [Venustampulla echinocandica]RDL29923.1 hypothetical protein BP5553_10550 [Venustampulla echinocandica]
MTQECDPVPMSNQEFFESLGLKTVTLTVGPHGKQRTAHLKLLSDAIKGAKAADLPLKFVEEDPEVFDDFLAWLYNPQRNHKVNSDGEWTNLLKLYAFGVKWGCEELNKSIAQILFCQCIPSDSNAPLGLIAILAKIEYLRHLNDYAQQCYTQMLRDFSRYFTNKSITVLDRLIEVYFGAMEAKCYIVQNKVISSIKNKLSDSDEWLRMDQMKEIFDKTQNFKPTPLRLFCVAQTWYRRYAMRDPGCMRLDAESVQQFQGIDNEECGIIFHEITGFMEEWMDFQQLVNHNSITEYEDPRGTGYAFEWEQEFGALYR